MSVSRRDLLVAVEARLETTPGLTVYKGEVPDQPPTIDETGRVKRYAVIYPGAGTPGVEENLADNTAAIDWPIQIQAVAGYAEDCLHAVDLIHGSLYGWIPVVAGHVCGPLKPPIGYQPGSVRRDDDVKPPRFWLPLLYTLSATT